MTDITTVRSKRQVQHVFLFPMDKEREEGRLFRRETEKSFLGFEEPRGFRYTSYRAKCTGNTSNYWQSILNIHSHRLCNILNKHISIHYSNYVYKTGRPRSVKDNCFLINRTLRSVPNETLKLRVFMQLNSILTTLAITSP